MFSLKVKTSREPPVILKGKVNGESTFKELKLALEEVTSIPLLKQKILIGYPPCPVQGSDSEALKTLGLKNGEVIFVEEIKSETSNFVNDAAMHFREDFTFPRGTLMKKVVPSDNSCLFTSVYFLINGGEIDKERLHIMRETVASEISRQPHTYNDALLEKSNADYCEWVVRETSWGGAIELSVFSDYYQTEIVALDAKSGLINRFGEDKCYIQRIFLMYDGIHYDPLYLETFDGRQLYIFPSSELWLLDQAQDLVQEAKSKGFYTDTNRFLLVCNECGVRMHGEEEAVNHARTTSHKDFRELKSA